MLLCGDNVQLVNSCIKKYRRYCRKDINIKFKLLYGTTQKIFCNKKDKTPFFNYYFDLSQSNCFRSILVTQVKQKKILHEIVLNIFGPINGALFEHIDECEVVKKLKNLMLMGTSLDVTITNLEYHVTSITFVKKKCSSN